MARHFGAKNKPKFALVSMADLKAKFGDSMEIPVSIDFVHAMYLRHKMVVVEAPTIVSVSAPAPEPPERAPVIRVMDNLDDLDYEKD